MPTVDLTSVVWRKSSRSNDGNDGNCVEVAFVGTAIAVRDSKNPGTALAFTADQWRGFLGELRQR